MAGGNRPSSQAEVSCSPGSVLTQVLAGALPSALWEALSSPALCPENSSCFGLPGHLAPSPQLEDSARLCIRPLPRHSLQAELGHCGAHLARCPLSEITACEVWYESHPFLYFVWFNCCCPGDSVNKSDPCYYSLARVRSLLGCPANIQMEILRR